MHLRVKGERLTAISEGFMSPRGYLPRTPHPLPVPVQRDLVADDNSIEYFESDPEVGVHTCKNGCVCVQVCVQVFVCFSVCECVRPKWITNF